MNYTQAEAQSLLGKRFETLVEWDGVGKGRCGHVIWSSGQTVWAVRRPYQKYQVVIAWDPAPGEVVGREPAARGCFSKFQIQAYMRELKI
jgi:hypothetical protein